MAYFEKRREEFKNGDRIIYCSYKEALELKGEYPDAIVELKDYIKLDPMYGLENLVCIIPEEFPKITEGFWEWDELSNTSPGLKNYVVNVGDETKFYAQHTGGGYDNEYYFIKGVIDAAWDTAEMVDINAGFIMSFPLCVRTIVTIKKKYLDY